MHEFSISGLFVLSVLFGVLIAMVVWVCTERPCNWYKVVALGGMGGTVGTVQGLILSSLLFVNKITESAMSIFCWRRYSQLYSSFVMLQRSSGPTPPTWSATQ